MDILILIFGIVICSFLSWHWLVSTDSMNLLDRIKSLFNSKQKYNHSESDKFKNSKFRICFWVNAILLFFFNISQILYIFVCGANLASQDYLGLGFYTMLLILFTLVALAWWMFLFKDFKEMSHNHRFIILYIGVSFIALYMTANNLDFLPNRVKYLFNIFYLAMPIFVVNEIQQIKEK